MDTPLVSVVVITYNSAQFVLETLESIKAQTYQNLELIISDDGSQDDTVNICQAWLQQHAQRFTATVCVAAKQNQGIPANCNKGIQKSTGEWIKIIAGDDVLLASCIEANLRFVLESGADICFSKMDYIDHQGNPLQRDEDYDAQLLRFFKKSKTEKQKAYLFNPLFLNVPTEFFSRHLYEKVDGFDEEIPLLEDQPFFYRVLATGFDLFYFDVPTVRYRKHSASTVLKPRFVQSIRDALTKYRQPRLSQSILGNAVIQLERFMLSNRVNGTNGVLNKIAAVLHYQITKI